jgi:transposase
VKYRLAFKVVDSPVEGTNNKIETTKSETYCFEGLSYLYKKLSEEDHL